MLSSEWGADVFQARAAEDEDPEGDGGGEEEEAGVLGDGHASAADQWFVGADRFFQDADEGVDADHQSGDLAFVMAEGIPRQQEEREEQCADCAVELRGMDGETVRGLYEVGDWESPGVSGGLAGIVHCAEDELGAGLLDVGQGFGCAGDGELCGFVRRVDVWAFRRGGLDLDRDDAVAGVQASLGGDGVIVDRLHDGGGKGIGIEMDAVERNLAEAGLVHVNG